MSSNEIKNILDEVQRDFNCGGLSDGLYADYATEVAKRFATVSNAELEGALQLSHDISNGFSIAMIAAEAELAALRELLYDAYELGQTDAAGNGTLAGVAYKDKKQVTAALLGDKK